MFQCRPLQSEDIDPVCTLPVDRAELFFMFPRASWPLTREQMIVQCYRRNNSTVVTDGDRVIAYANIYQLDKGEKCFIGNLVVDQDYRGRGVATLLINHMQQIAIDQHWVKAVHISVFDKNEAALNLYKGLGFVAYAEEEKSDPDGRRVMMIHMKKPC